MTTPRYRLLSIALLAVLALSAWAGCRRSDPANNSPTDTAFELGNRIEQQDFEPPSLEDLDAEAGWTSNPVVSTLELRREYLAEHPPEATVAEALEMHNDSDEDNEIILSALGRLPESDDEVDWDATFRRHLAVDAKSLNPLCVSSSAEFEVTGLMTVGLTTFDWDFETYGDINSIESWETSSDGMIDKFVLRQDLFWSDGQPVTAHDYVFAYQVVMSDAVPVTSRTAEEQIKWVEAYDDYTLVIFHKKPLAVNRQNCGLSAFPKHVFEDTIADDPTMQNSKPHVAFEQTPVVAGPYQVTRREKGTEIVLERREEYYMQDGEQVREKPYFKKIIFLTIEDPNTALLALKAGRIDDYQMTPDQWISQTNDAEFYADNTKVRATEWAASNFTWNIGTPFFKDKESRWAMSYAFDHEEMLSSVYFDLYEPCRGVFHPTSKWAPDPAPEAIHRDLEKAKELLAQAGWIDHDGDGILDKEIDGEYVPFEFTVLTTNRPTSTAVCSLLKQNLADLGITCNLSVNDFTSIQEKTKDHRYHASIGGWGSATDPYHTQNLFGTDEDRNFSQYSNPEVDELFEAGMAEMDPQKRIEIYQEIHMLLWEDQVFTWLANPATFYAFNKDLRGYAFSPRGPYSYGPGFFSIWKPKDN